MSQNIDDLLDLTLTEIEKGKGIEDCLKDYPEFASELEPLLRIAFEIKGLHKPEPSPESFDAVLPKVRQLWTETQQSQRKFSLAGVFSYRPMVVRIAAVVLLVVLFGWSSIALSSRTIPGDLLYPRQEYGYRKKL